MAYKKIGTNWTGEMRKDIDTMFKELFDEYLGAGMNAEDAREKAMQAVASSDLAKQLAEQANLTSEQVRTEMNNIIREQTSGGDVVPEVVSARGSEATLGERLNKTDEELAENVQEIVLMNDELVNKRDKGVKITKSDYDLSQNTNKWDLNDLNEQSREAILENNEMDINYVLGEDSVVRDNYSNGSVFPEKTSFAKSKNLAVLVSDVGFSGPVGDWVYTESEGSYCYIAKVEKGKSYTISDDGNSNRFRVATGVGHPVVGGGFARDVIDRSVAEGTREYSITMEGNEDYIIVYVATPSTALPDSFQIEEGEKRTRYSKPGKVVHIELEDDSVNLTSIKHRTGKLVGNEQAFNVVLDDSKIQTTDLGGTILTGDRIYRLKSNEYSFSQIGTNTVLVYFDVNTGDLLFKNGQEGIEVNNTSIFLGHIRKNNRSVNFYGEYLVDGESSKFIPEYSGRLAGVPDAFNVDLINEEVETSSAGGFVQVGESRYGLKTDSYSYADVATNTILIAFNISNWNVEFIEYSSDSIRLKSIVVIGAIRRNKSLVDVNGFYSINGNEVRPYTGSASQANGRLFFPNIPSGDFKSNIDYVDRTRDIDLIYDIYDEGVDYDPTYATKTFIKNEESGLPLNRYDLKPVGMRTSINTPEIIYTCTHGHENSATYGGALFFRDLMMNWRDSPILELLRWNIHFIIIPNLNPWGFNNNSRPNFNGVDLARNFSAGWSPEYTDIDYDFPGTEPLSEIGTQTLDQTLKDHPDALYLFDHHNFGGDPQDGAELIWTGTPNETLMEMQDQYTYNMAYRSKINFDIDFDLDLGRSIIYNRGGTTVRQAAYRGINAMIIENAHKINGSFEEGQKFNSNSIGNAILSVLRYYS